MLSQHCAVTTLLTARFVPLARIPAYVACGYFKMNYAKFCAIIFMTALIYCIVIFTAIHLLGEVFGERMEVILGLAAGAVILTVVGVFGIKTALSKRGEAKDEI